MNRILACALALTFATAAHAQTLERQRHDHTIYTVHGTADQLAKFQGEVGSQWEGGILLDQDADPGTSRYWAFSDRTALQARQFMFGSMAAGLTLDIEAYEEQRFFPAERSELDEIAIRCAFASDPFFITPLRELRLVPRPSVSLESVDCGLAKIKSSKRLRELPMGIVGSAALPEKAN